MYYYSKNIERLIRFLKYLIPLSFKSNHKYQNKNQITTTDTVMYLLKKKNFNPEFIIDVGCGYGEWTKKSLKYFKSSNYLLFDGDSSNQERLKKFTNKKSNLFYKICILSDKIKNIKFYNSGYGSSIYKENNNTSLNVSNAVSTTLFNELLNIKIMQKNNLIKLDVQGSEIDILKGLGNKMKLFEVIILEVSTVEYNKNAPLFFDVHSFMNNNNYKLYDICDSKRLGNDNSFLIQFDAVFVNSNSNLWNHKY